MQYALIREEQASGTNGGTPVLSTWTPRVLNTKTFDPSNIIANLASNQFTLNNGVYIIRATSAFYATLACKVRLYNVTDSAVLAYGLNAYYQNAQNEAGIMSVAATVNLASSKTYRLEYYVNQQQANTGLGFPSSIAGVIEVYSQVEVFKTS